MMVTRHCIRSGLLRLVRLSRGNPVHALDPALRSWRQEEAILKRTNSLFMPGLKESDGPKLSFGCMVRLKFLYVSWSLCCGVLWVWWRWPLT